MSQTLEDGADRVWLERIEQAWDELRSNPAAATQRMNSVFDSLEDGLGDDLRLHRAAWRSHLHFIKGDLPACMAAVEEARELSHAAAWARCRRIVVTNEGRAKALMGRYPEALACFQELYDTAVAEGHRSAMAGNLNNMGIVCCSNGDVEMARRFYFEALEIHRENGDLSGECFVYNNLAMFPLAGEEEQALDWARHALALARQADHESAVLMVLDTVAGLLLKLERREEAARILEEAESLARSMKVLRLLLPVLVNRVRLALTVGQPRQALVALDEAEALAEELAMEPERVVCHQLRSQALEELGDLPEALAELRKHLERKARLMSQENQQRITTLQILYQTAGQRREEERQRRKAEELAALVAVGRKISAVRDSLAVLEEINLQARLLLRASDAATYLLQDGQEHLRAVVVDGSHMQPLKGRDIPVCASLAGAVCLAGGTEMVNRPEDDPRALVLEECREQPPLQPHMFAIAAAALRHGQTPLGVLVLWRERGVQGEFLAEELRLLGALAQQAAIALHNVRLIEDLRAAKLQAETALAEVRTLAGFLPICANCKNIRDDAGYWHSVADYMRTHTEAEFSQGLCPACKDLPGA